MTEVMVIAWCSFSHIIMKVQRKLIFWKFSLLLKIKLTNYTHGSDKEDWFVPNCATFFYYFFFNIKKLKFHVGYHTLKECVENDNILFSFGVTFNMQTKWFQWTRVTNSKIVKFMVQGYKHNVTVELFFSWSFWSFVNSLKSLFCTSGYNFNQKQCVHSPRWQSLLLFIM